jgi:heme-degrading monooxygenase HmoA
VTIARIWTTRIDIESTQEYERFARERSLPMFARQPGYRGVLMLGNGSERTVISLWDQTADAEALGRSRDYLDTVQDILAAGFIRGEQTLTVMQVDLTDLTNIAGRLAS